MRRWIQRRFKNGLKAGFFRLYKLGVRLGWYVLPAHYYASEPNIIELERTLNRWIQPSAMVGVSMDADRQLAELRRVCMPFRAEYLGNDAYNSAVAERYGPGFGYVEAQLLHAVLRSYRSRRVIEVGSGVSTRCAEAALQRNAEAGNERGVITCIEPYPSPELRKFAARTPTIQLIESPVQAVSHELYQSLGPGDILFVDSSHVVRPGSDVNHIVLEVLPRLESGVLVHFHDIYFPYDYQRDVLTTFLHSNESSLLQAFLTFNKRFRILFSLSYLHYNQPDALKDIFPEYIPQAGYYGLRAAHANPAHHFPSSVWLEVGLGDASDSAAEAEQNP